MPIWRSARPSFFQSESEMRTFTMSQYATKSHMLEAKAEYFEQLVRELATVADDANLSDAEFRQLVRDRTSGAKPSSL